MASAGASPSVGDPVDPADFGGLITFSGLTFTGASGDVPVAIYNMPGSVTNTVTIDTALITLSATNQVYDGTARTVVATTVPTGLVVEITYDGSLLAPTNVGSYAVTGTVNELTYEGEATAVLSITQAVATVAFSDTTQVYDGTARAVGVTTAPTGLAVNVTYDGSFLAPTNAGSYAVTGTVAEANYQGEGTAVLTVTQAVATVAFSDTTQGYDGTARAVGVTTAPTGLAVSVTYDGSFLAPTNAGSYAVTGTVAEAN